MVLQMEVYKFYVVFTPGHKFSPGYVEFSINAFGVTKSIARNKVYNILRDKFDNRWFAIYDDINKLASFDKKNCREKIYD